MRPDPVNSTHAKVDIHPYVQGRLRALPRHDEAAGILLGTVENGVTHITGFKRAPASALRQVAEAAGDNLAGFYRLRTPNAPMLRPEEEAIWRQTQPVGPGLFLLVNAVNGAAEDAIAWTRKEDGEPSVEFVSLLTETSPPLTATPVPEPRAATPPAPAPAVAEPELPESPRPLAAWKTALLASSVTAAGFCAYLFWPSTRPATLDIDLQSRAGELTAHWQQSGAPKGAPQAATLTIRDGGKEEVRDLLPQFTPEGRVTLRPRSADVVVTLRVQHAGQPPVVRAATYIGFAPSLTPAATAPPPAAAQPAHLAEIASLRKRNKELEDAVGALRKHFHEKENGSQ